MSRRPFLSPTSSLSASSTASLLSSGHSSYVLVDNPDPQLSDISNQLLVAQLTLSDLTAHVGSLRQTPSGVGPRSYPNYSQDDRLALSQQESELRAWITYLQDSILARSVDSAIEADRQMLQALAAVEASEREDRRAAETLAREGRLPLATDAQKAVGRRGFVIPESNTVSRSSVGTTSSGSAPTVVRVECISCSEKFPQNQCLTAPCAHVYCHGCVISLVEACIKDETLHPVKCCRQPFPFASLAGLLNVGLRQQFETKCREYRVPAEQRLYCSNPGCSAFLGTSTPEGQEREDIICGTCRTQTCTSCKERSHPDSWCLKLLTKSDMALLNLARQENWQTCPGCHSIVSLTQGCYHMTCRCRTEFCYLCATRWKNCTCPQWGERHLITDAARRVENEMGQEARQAEPRAFENRVRDRVEGLRVEPGEECTVHVWQDRNEAGRCEECSDWMPIFLKICRNCSMLVCRRCALNRL